MSQSKTQNPSRNHHYIPKFYLRGFSTFDKNFVWVYRRGRIYAPGKNSRRSNPSPAALKVAGMKRDFYTCFNRDGSVDYGKYDSELNKRESEGAQLLQKLCQGERLKLAEKKEFAYFIFLMNQRTPTRQENFPEMYRSVYKTPDEFYQEMAMYIEDQWGRLMTEEEKKYLRKTSEECNDSPPDEIRLRSMLGGLAQCQEKLVEMKWSILFAPINEFFVTSDNPICISGALKNRESQILFPLSSRCALWAAHQNTSEIELKHINRSTTNKINQDICSNATAEVYASREDASIVGMLKHQVTRL